MVIQPDTDVDQTLLAFREVQQALAEPCFNDGKPLGALALQRLMDQKVKGSLSAQMTISALRTVCAAYQRAKSHKKPAQHPFLFKKARALFLLGKRGRDADFREDGTLSIWTVGGRTHLYSAVPEDFQATLSQAKELASLHVIKRDGRLIGRVTLTLQAPDPQGLLPVGIDLNETNALGAVDPDGRELFMSGKAARVKNCRTARTRARLQRNQAARKAEHKETRRVRRVLKRLGRKQRNRTRTFAQQTAKQLVTWAPENAVLVFEHLQIPQPQKGKIRGRALRRRMGLWQRALIRPCVENKAQECGMRMAEVNPADTSKTCSRCGLRGVRRRHCFTCPHCGFSDHADLNAARNIRHTCTLFRESGDPSMSPEAQAVLVVGKPPRSREG